MYYLCEKYYEPITIQYYIAVLVMYLAYLIGVNEHTLEM